MAVSLSIIPSLSFSSRHFPSKPHKRFDMDKVQSFKRHKELENGGGNCANNCTLVFNQVYRSVILPDINFGGKKVTLLNKEDNVGPIRRVNVVLVDTKAYQLTECTLDSIGGITLEIKAAGSTYGTFFCVTTFGESHGAGIGCVIDGCPPRLPLSEADIQLQLDRRRPGQNRGTTPREEADACQISSGIADGLTTGSPIKIEVPNTNTRGRDYNELSKAYRPSHADATYDFKYGLRSIEGGGRSSARETIGRVAAGAIAKKILKQFSGTEVLAYTSRVHKVVLTEDLVDYDTLTLDQIESNIVRCPNPEYAEKMIAAIDAVRESGDSAGGIVTCIVRNVPRGLGSPVFDKLEAELAKAVLSVPASTGFEFGRGFAGSSMIGSEHNDEFYIDENGRIRTITNRSGGIQGGISNGETISMKIAFKPIPTINKKQKTVTRDKHETELIFLGRQEPCIAPRAVPVVEAMVAMVLVDQLMAQYAQCMLFPINPTLQEPIGSLRTEILN